MSSTDTVSGQLASVARACAQAESFQQSEVLGKAWTALSALPPDLRRATLPGVVSADRFSRLIAIGAHETAAIELLGNGLGYIASRSPNGHYIATVNGPGGEEFTEPAETLALGLVAGLMKLLQSLHRDWVGGAYVLN